MKETFFSILIDLLSFKEMIPVSSLIDTVSKTLHASLAKSKSLTSVGPTAIMANASLSSLIGAQPTYLDKSLAKEIKS